jgi:hypothetical protein
MPEQGLIDTPRTTVVACMLQGNAAYWAHCGDSRLYLVRGDKLIARTRDHSYSELQEALGRVVPDGERFNRNVLFTCLGSPGKPMVDTVGPLLLQPATACCCAPTACGARCRRRDHRAADPTSHRRRRARTGRAGLAQRRRRAATTSPCWRSNGKRRGRQPSGDLHADARRTPCLHPPSRERAGPRTSTSSTMAEIERSIREINEAALVQENEALIRQLPSTLIGANSPLS